jgi:hypothetical protein
MYNPYQKIESIKDVIPLLDNDDTLILPICKSTITISKAYLDLKEDEYVLMDRNRATVAGLMVKIHKCFIECVNAYQNGKSEIISLYQRVIYEAYVKQMYLIKYGEKAQEQYRLIAYKNRFEYYKNTKDEANESLNAYNHCRNTKFLESIKEDGFTLEMLEQNKRWKLDGKNFRQLLNDVEIDELYLSIYGISSDIIHSDWGEISQYHLIDDKDSHFMAADIEYKKCHYRQILSILDIVLSSIKGYSIWLEEEFDINLITFDLLINDFDRVNNLIFEHILNIYKDDPQEFLYN